MKVRMKFYTRINEQGCVETACQLDIGDGFEYFGTSQQNPLDKQNSHIGNRTALIELLNGESDSFTRKSRLKIWQHFHEHYKPKTDKPKGYPTHFDGKKIGRNPKQFIIKKNFTPFEGVSTHARDTMAYSMFDFDKHTPETIMSRYGSNGIGKDLDLRLLNVKVAMKKIETGVREIDRLMGGGDARNRI